MGIIADFNIICLNQEKPEFIEDDSIRYEIRDLTANEILYVMPEWDVFKAFKGIWYYIYPEDWEEKLYLPEREFFDFRYKEGEYSDLINGLKRKKNRLRWTDERREDVKKLIEFYLEKSPIHRVVVMCCIQDKEVEAVVGTLTKREFFSKMNAWKLRYNIAYIVRG